MLNAFGGVGADWPVSYDELEPYYCDAEDIMSVAGPPNEDSPFPRSRLTRCRRIASTMST